MSQGFDSTIPVTGAAVASAPVRTNFNALATDNSGSSAPSSPQEGWRWLDNTNRVLYMYANAGWHEVMRFDTNWNLVENWSTVSTATTAEINKNYFVNTTSAAFTITLPASPVAGNTVRISDVAGSLETNNLTIARNGNLILGGTDDLTADVNYASITLIYSGATYGWVFQSK